MYLILIIVFVSAFVVAALLFIGIRPSRPESVQTTARPARPVLSLGSEEVRKVVKYSAIPWLNRMLQKMELAPRLRMLLYQAGMKWSVGQLLLMCLACSALPLYLALLRPASALLFCGIGLAAGFAPFAALMFRRSQRFARFDEELPKALDLIVSALRAGYSFNAALELVAREAAEPVRSEFGMCFGEQYYGLDLRDAMENLVTRIPVKHLRIATTVVLVQKETGGNLAEVLANTAEVMRERNRLKRQVLVHTAHGRLTGWVIGLLPLVLLILLYSINPGLESLLWKRELGVKLLCAGAGMMALGGIVINKIVRLDV